MRSIFFKMEAYIVIFLGVALSAFGIMGFLVPAEIVTGGCGGISMIIYYLTGIEVGTSYMILATILLLSGWRKLGRGFGLRTIFATICFSIGLYVFQKVITTPLVKDDFMATMIGAVLSGFGLALIFLRDASTGGTDILALIINKYKNISPGKLILFMDVVIITSSYMIFHSIEKIIYGYVFIGVCSYVIDLVLIGSKRSAQLFIMSKKYKEIADFISRSGIRGLTKLKAEGGYTGEDFEVIMVIVRRYELHMFMKQVYDIDSEAFISVGNVMGVYGKGFDEIKLPKKIRE